jgi:hypothetical protein
MWEVVIGVRYPTETYFSLLYRGPTQGHNIFIRVVLKTAREVEHLSSEKAWSFVSAASVQDVGSTLRLTQIFK